MIDGGFADSRVFLRTLAYTGVYCDDIPWGSFRRGDVVTGVLESTNDPRKPEERPSSCLVGWKFKTFAELVIKNLSKRAPDDQM